MNVQHDLFEARRDRDVAIKVAIDHANDVEPRWSDRALVYLEQYILLFGEPFRCEQVREWATDNGLSEPPTTRAWGGVIAGAAKRGIIRRVGYTNSICKDQVNTHMSVVSLWAGV